MKRIYLDHNASAPLRPEARAAVLRHLDEAFGNPSSVHDAGHRAKMAVESARTRVAGLVNADPDTIVFTGGGTEANNMAIYGAALSAPPGTRRIVTSAFEHPSVAAVIADLERHGFEVIRVRPDRSGVVPSGTFLEAARSGQTAIASLMLANNEIGTLQPIESIGSELRRRGILFHCDAAQAIGKVDVDVASLPVDLLTLAAHKFGGPQGAGALYIRRGIVIEPHLRGGGQEMNRRPGTENVAALAAFGAAAAATTRTWRHDARRMWALRERLESSIQGRGLASTINGSEAPRISNTSSVAFDAISGETLVIALDLEGIAVSAGAACSAGAIRSSPTLESMGLPREAATSIRISLGPGTTDDEIDRCVDILAATVPRLRRANVRQEASVRI